MTPKLIHEFDRDDNRYPTSAREAIDLLLEGNAKIRKFHDDCRIAAERTGETPNGAQEMTLSARQVGLNHLDDLGFPKQAPWAVFLGCADARVPSEMLFGQGFNDLFDIRVAGNVLSDESSASLIFALRHFTEPTPGLPTVKLAVVLGHRGCGAVKAVVDHYQTLPPGTPVEDAMNRLGHSPLENLMRRIYCPAFAEVAASYSDPSDPALRSELIEKTVVANVRLTAEKVARIVQAESAAHPHVAGVTVAYGAYDPFTFEVSDHAFTTIERATPSRERKSRLGLVGSAAADG